MEAEQAPVQVGQFILAKNLGIGAFGKVSWSMLMDRIVDTVTSHHLGLRHCVTVLRQ